MAVPSTFEELAAAVEAEAAMFEERSTDLHDRSPGGFGVFDPKKFVRIQDGAS